MRLRSIEKQNKPHLYNLEYNRVVDSFIFNLLSIIINIISISFSFFICFIKHIFFADTFLRKIYRRKLPSLICLKGKNRKLYVFLQKLITIKKFETKIRKECFKKTGTSII